jgi:hypothetical protein
MPRLASLTSQTRRSPKARRVPRNGCRPSLDWLEGRLTPAAFLVSTAADAGPGSLRAALEAANADPGPSTITFDPALNGQRITATSGALPAITANGLTIQGPGASALTLDGARNGPVLVVGASGGVTISGLTLTGGGSGTGFGVTSGGGIVNGGSLALVGCVVTQNGVLSEGFAASGGGISNAGTMTVTGCVIAGNSASGALQRNPRKWQGEGSR